MFYRVNKRNFSTPDCETSPLNDDNNGSRFKTPRSLNRKTVTESGYFEESLEESPFASFRSPLKSSSYESSSEIILPNNQSKSTSFNVRKSLFLCDTTLPYKKNGASNEERELLRNMKSLSISPKKSNSVRVHRHFCSTTKKKTYQQIKDLKTIDKAARQLFIDEDKTVKTGASHTNDNPKEKIPTPANIVIQILDEACYLLPKIMSYLEPQDLMSVMQVNRQFHSTTVECKILMGRVKNFVNKKKAEIKRIGKVCHFY